MTAAVFWLFAVALVAGAWMPLMSALGRGRTRLGLLPALLAWTMAVYLLEGRPDTLAAARTHGTPPALPAAPVLSGEVEISPQAAAALGPASRLYVYARRTDGTPMPVAAYRASPRAGRQAFALDDAMSLLPGLPLSGFDEVLLAAMLSPDGAADPSAGGWEAPPQRVARGTRGVLLVVDRPR